MGSTVASGFLTEDALLEASGFTAIGSLDGIRQVSSRESLGAQGAELAAAGVGDGVGDGFTFTGGLMYFPRAGASAKVTPLETESARPRIRIRPIILKEPTILARLWET
jgi:hypothetical protein